MGYIVDALEMEGLGVNMSVIELRAISKIAAHLLYEIMSLQFP